MLRLGIPCLEAVDAAPIRNEFPEYSLGGIPDLVSTWSMWWWNQKHVAKLPVSVMNRESPVGTWIPGFYQCKGIDNLYREF